MKPPGNQEQRSKEFQALFIVCGCGIKGGGMTQAQRRPMGGKWPQIPQDFRTGTCPDNSLSISNLCLSFSLCLSHLCLSQDTLSVLLTEGSPVVTAKTKNKSLYLAVIIRTFSVHRLSIPINFQFE